MTLSALLTELRRRDIQVWCEGEQLRCNAPAGALSAELREQLRLSKAELLEFLRAAQAEPTGPRAIVPLQKDGSLTPIFAVPGHSGDVFGYRAFAQALGKDQPFYGLQPPGVDGTSAPLTSVEQLAAYFVQQVRTMQPNGALIIAGFCAGGAVAFELAQQLIAAGASVEYIALFGSPYPVFFGLLSQFRQRTARRLRRLAEHVAALATGNWHHLVSKWRERTTRRTAAQDPVLRYRDAVERATVRAVRRYRPVRFPGELRLFVPSASWGRANLALRWRRMAVWTDVYYGPEGCTNDTMLLAPQASFFAALFRRAGARRSLSPSRLHRSLRPTARRATA